MCLEIADRKINREICNGIGWKVFVVDRGNLYGDNFAKTMVRPKHKWLDEKKFRGRKGTIKADNHIRYPAGWHIFTTRRDCIEWGGSVGVRQVEYKKVLATGTQSRYPVIIAKWIRIGGPGPIKKKVQK